MLRQENIQTKDPISATSSLEEQFLHSIAICIEYPKTWLSIKISISRRVSERLPRSWAFFVIRPSWNLILKYSNTLFSYSFQSIKICPYIYFNHFFQNGVIREAEQSLHQFSRTKQFCHLNLKLRSIIDHLIHHPNSSTRFSILPTALPPNPPEMSKWWFGVASSRPCTIH